MSSLGRTLRAIAVNAHSVWVLQRAGMIDLTAPAQVLHTSRTVRTYGAIAGPLRASARREPDRIALIDEIGSLTYRELDQRSNALARGFTAASVGPGATVAALCRDHRGLVDVMIATAKIGARLVLLNTGFSGPQLADVAVREDVTALVYDEEFSELLAGVAPSVTRFLAWSTTTDSVARIEDIIAANSDDELEPPVGQGGFVLLTGGTTGTPRGVPRKVSSPLAAAAFLDRVPLRRNEVVVSAAPLFHGTALTQFIMALSLASTVVIRRRFDAEATIASIATHRATALVVVPTMLRRILDVDTAVRELHDTSSLRIVFCAGAALPAALGNAAHAAFGPVIYNFYGSTEVGVATISTPEEWDAAPGTVGSPPRSCTVRIYDEHDVEITEPGRSGTIYVGSALSFSGYSGGGGKKAIDGLLSSGDVGHWDHGGRLFIDGRDDDMIVSGGENVYPGEVEELLYAHPGVAEAAIAAVDDEEFGQRLAAYIVRRPGHTLDADDVRRYVRDNLARFKVPRDVTFVDDLPRTATGKLLRRDLTGN
ncbi:fatty-acyl-CoA synthase [Nocardia neocaledoniensis NBRC 108232]|uniref:Fatty-acyl-CoA synthase n=2 Tax=Nocardia neocaledoniensis TaxID=236511 RepID=A0A317N8Q8_9NOCA|nr:AMP-binding protein [Nocardia neocaledoniensis]PWV71067.1 fatty-acyl-CoA synthase [Nocardia neocaledoniensis]GEM30264.1 fatty-acyl-CoA synthase [Nocardia neocaledoniensis NBRC 108232]